MTEILEVFTQFFDREVLIGMGSLLLTAILFRIIYVHAQK